MNNPGRLLFASIAVAFATIGQELHALGLDELYRLDRLPAFKTSAEVGSVSSYDRSGGNDDGFSGKDSFVRKDSEGLVLADLQGPGIIYRIWTPTPTDDLLEFVLDGEAQPRLTLKFRELFLGHNPSFPNPLSGFGGGGYYTYVPISFAKSCLVRIRAPKMQFYQINYALYPAGTSLSSFEAQPSDATKEAMRRTGELWAKAGTDITPFTAPPGATVDLSTGRMQLKPHETQTAFETKQGGRIVGIRLSPASAIAGKERDLLLKISFDEDEPAIFCPLGDFFGYAWGQPAMRSLLVGTQSGTDYCYLPMPFDRGAKIEIVSERKEPVELAVEVAHCAVPRSADEGKLYALWRRENPTTLGQPYTFLQTEGRGHLVGVVLQAQGMQSGQTLFFEGDDTTTIDGKLVIHGTGSEDFFNGGWYDVPDRWEKRISFPLSGCLGYAKHLSRTGGYRFFLGDAYAYRDSLLQQIEHAGEKNSIPTDYCSTTYFYAESRPKIDLAPPPLPKRAVEDLTEIVFPAWWQLPIAAWSFQHASLTRKQEKIAKEEVRYVEFSAEGQDWFGPHFLSPVCDCRPRANMRFISTLSKGPPRAASSFSRMRIPSRTQSTCSPCRKRRAGECFSAICC